MSEKGGYWNGITTDMLHIPYSIFRILIPRSVYIGPHFVSLGKFVDISYANHSGAIMICEFRMLQIPEPFHLHAALLICLAWHGRRCQAT